MAIPSRSSMGEERPASPSGAEEEEERDGNENEEEDGKRRPRVVVRCCGQAGGRAPMRCQFGIGERKQEEESKN